MKITRKDQQAIAKLFCENLMPDVGEPEVVMEIEPIAPVEVEEDDNDLDHTLKVELKKIVTYGNKLLQNCNQTHLEPWMLAKLSKAADYICDVYYQMDLGADYANMGHDDISDDEMY